MFKSGSKKSEQEIDLHQEARLDKNQVESGQFRSIGDLYSSQGHKYLLLRSGRSADPVTRTFRHGEMKDLVSKNDQKKTQLLNDNKRQCMTL